VRVIREFVKVMYQNISGQLTYQQLYFPTTFLPPSTHIVLHDLHELTHDFHELTYDFRELTYPQIQKLQRYLSHYLLTFFILLHDFHELTHVFHELTYGQIWAPTISLPPALLPWPLPSLTARNACVCVCVYVCVCVCVFVCVCIYV